MAAKLVAHAALLFVLVNVPLVWCQDHDSPKGISWKPIVFDVAAMAASRYSSWNFETESNKFIQNENGGFDRRKAILYSGLMAATEIAAAKAVSSIDDPRGRKIAKRVVDVMITAVASYSTFLAARNQVKWGRGPMRLLPWRPE